MTESHPTDDKARATVSLSAIVFFLALNAWSWACAFTFHEATFFDITPDMKPDGTPVISAIDGMQTHSYSPKWYALPLLGNMAGGYLSLIVYACKRWG